MINELFVGIDVAKVWLDVAWLPGEMGLRIAYDEVGMVCLVERLTAERPTLVVLDATGGLETEVASRLAAASRAAGGGNAGGAGTQVSRCAQILGLVLG